MSHKNLQLAIGGSLQDIAVDRLVVAGWVGKDREALQKHIDELAELGIEPPSRTPTYMNLSPATLTTEARIEVVGDSSSGEVECVIITGRDGQRFLGVGSDHTDREFEKYGIPASKQMCAKPIANEAWLFSDVMAHLDALILRSWMIKDGQKFLYQEGPLSLNRDLNELVQNIPDDCISTGESYCLFCGTFAAIGGLKYGERFEFELYDPVLDRRINHGYDIEVLRQFL
jgi:hypothetical protein